MSRFSSREEFEEWKAARPLQTRQPEPDPDSADAERTEKAVKRAWIAGAGIGVLMLIAVVLSANGVQVLDLTLWGLIDVALILVLSFGVYAKNRTSALLLPLYLVISRTYIWIKTGAPYGLGVTIICGYFFLQGIRGAFSSHVAAESDSDTPSWKPVAAAISLAALFVLLLFGEQAGLPVDLSPAYYGGPRPAAAADWIPLVSAEGGFSIDLPGEPALDTKTVDVGGAMRPVSSYSLLLSKNYAYTVHYMDAPARETSDAHAIEIDLDSARDLALEDTGGNLVREDAVNLVNGTGREVLFEKDRTAFRALLVKANHRIYQVVATAPKEFIFSGDVNRFLSSFRPKPETVLTADDTLAVDTWQDFSPPGGRFTVDVPRLPVAGQESVRTSGGEMTLHLFELDRAELRQKFSVQYADYPEALMRKLRSADKALSNASTVDVENIRGTLVSEKTLSLGRYPGRELQIENTDTAMKIRLYFVERRLYKITTVRPRQTGFSEDDDKFMTSFQLTP